MIDSFPLRHDEGSPVPPPTPAALTAIERFFSGWRFPAWFLSLLVTYGLALLAALLWPAGADGLGQFALEFKTWCFGYDPATGRMETMLVAMMIGEPLGLALFIGLLWQGPLSRIGWRQLRAPVLTALLLVGAGTASFGLLHQPALDPSAPLPFPADALRTHLPSPDFQLVDQEGAALSPQDLRGRVVLVTGVYARCGQTCPMILAQTKRAVARLSEAERAGLTVVGVTLDPGHDTPQVLAGLAAAQGMAAPLYRLASGAPDRVERLLDQVGITRSRDAETGVISHANLFLLIDRQGKVAYRFTLGELQEQWLISGLRVLLAEPSPVG
ncbi:MAG: SCO family protein [Myxococcota bacterium]|nr:SCO family protein [Myxococcota bacterium]